MERTLLRLFNKNMTLDPEYNSKKRSILLLGSLCLFILVCCGLSHGQTFGSKLIGEKRLAVGREFDVTYGWGYCLDEFQVRYLKALKLDIYYPLEPSTEKKPAMVIIHGGVHGNGTFNKRTIHFVEAAKFFAARGMVCFCIDFRIRTDKPDCSGENEYLRAQWASYVDAKTAIRWIRSNADLLGVDENKIATYGGSSGAGAAIMLGITNPDEYATDYPGGQIPLWNNPLEDPTVQVCVEFWGTCYNMEHGQPPKPILFDFSEHFDMADATPIVLFHGTEDDKIPFWHAEDIALACMINNIPYLFYILEGATHGAWDFRYGDPPRPLNDWVWDYIRIDLDWCN
jgi:acetyl esterase/lipase